MSYTIEIKKEISEISFSSIPFIEKVKQSNNYFNSFPFNEDDFREKLKRKNNSFESFFSSLKKSSDYNNDDKKIDSIVNGLKNNNFNVNTMESEEEDLGTSLAKAVFGNDYKNNIERKNNDFLSNYSLNNKNDSLNNFKDEEELELDFNINRARVS